MFWVDWIQILTVEVLTFVQISNTQLVSERGMINVDISTIDNYNTEQRLETMVWVDIWTVDSGVCNIELWWQIQGPDNNGQYRSYQAAPVIPSSHQPVSSVTGQLHQVKDKLDILLKHFVSHNNLDYWLTNDAYPMWNIIIQISSHDENYFLKRQNYFDHKPKYIRWSCIKQKVHHVSKFWPNDF